MEQRVDIVTLRTQNVDAATAFYVDALGWEPLLRVHNPGWSVAEDGTITLEPVE